MYLEYETPGPPYHPADLLMAKWAHERRMEEIREMDIQEWVKNIQEAQDVAYKEAV